MLFKCVEEDPFPGIHSLLRIFIQTYIYFSMLEYKASVFHFIVTIICCPRSALAFCPLFCLQCGSRESLISVDGTISKTTLHMSLQPQFTSELSLKLPPGSSTTFRCYRRFLALGISSRDADTWRQSVESFVKFKTIFTCPKDG